jgi:hypothetical protein
MSVGGRERSAVVYALEPNATLPRMSEVSEPVSFQAGYWSDKQERYVPVPRLI